MVLGSWETAVNNAGYIELSIPHGQELFLPPFYRWENQVLAMLGTCLGQTQQAEELAFRAKPHSATVHTL